MNYSNPQIPEGINVTPVHPLKEFFTLIAGVGAVVIVAVILLALLAQWLVSFIPFEKEQQWLGSLGSSFVNSQKIENIPETDGQVESYLQNLADKLSKAQGLPADIKIKVHYIEADTVNAFATLGGNVVIYKGLLEQLPHENALSMVMAHEIAHVKHRHPIMALGRGVAIGLALVSVSGVGDGSLSQQLLGNISLLTVLSFSRSQEIESDNEALETLLTYYGHLEGADALFHVLQQEYEGMEPPQFLSTHPHTDHRIERVNAIQSELMMSEKLVALPEYIFNLKDEKNISE